MSFAKIFKARNGIVKRGGVIGVKRVHREIAPFGILDERAAISDCRAPPIGLDILAQRGDFEGVTVVDECQGAVVQPCGDCFYFCFLRAGHNLFWQECCSKVDVNNSAVKQSIAHSPSHNHGTCLLVVEQSKQVLHVGTVDNRFQARGFLRCQSGDRQEFGIAHLKCPGTRTPFSVCAGT